MANCLYFLICACCFFCTFRLLKNIVPVGFLFPGLNAAVPFPHQILHEKIHLKLAGNGLVSKRYGRHIRLRAEFGCNGQIPAVALFVQFGYFIPPACEFLQGIIPLGCARVPTCGPCSKPPRECMWAVRCMATSTIVLKPSNMLSVTHVQCEKSAVIRSS